MSDVVVSTTASTTVVTTSSTAVNVAVTTYPVSVSASSVGLQGATGATGATGAQGSAGAPGASGVISVSSPITNSGSSSSAILGLDQASLSLTKSQISDFTSGTVASAGTAQQAGTAVYSTSSGSALNAGTAVTISGSITKSQVSDFTSGTVAVATSATSANTALTAGTASYATTSGTAVYATTSGTATYATTSGTAVNISGTVTSSQVSGLPAIYASLGSANSFTLGPQILNTGASTSLAVTVRGASSQTSDLQQWQTSASAVLGGVTGLGQIYSGSTNPLPAYYQSSAGTVTAITYISATQATITNNNTSQVVSVGSWVVIGGVSSNTTYNGTWLVTAIGGSSGAYTFTIQGSGFSNASTVLTSATYNLAGAASFQSLNSQTPAIITRAATGQVANLIEAQSPNGTALLFRVASSGAITTAGITSTGSVTISGSSNPLTVGGTAGTSGQVLTSQGTGVSPAWTTISSGGNYGSIPKTGYYYSQTGYDVFNSTTINTSAGVSYAVPFYLGASTTATRLMLQVSTAAASSTARLGIYSNASGGDYPGTLLLDAGAVATTTTGFKQITISQALSAGVYWLSIQRTDTGAGAVNYLGADGLNSDMNPGLSMPMTSIASPANAGNILGWKQTGAGTAFQTTWAGTGLASQVPVIWIGF